MNPVPFLSLDDPSDPVPAQSQPHPRLPWHWALWQGLMTYLPLVIMAILALGTWWLVRQIKLPSDAPRAAIVRHEPDYEMRRFAIQRFAPTGELRALIEGDVIRHFPDTDTLEIDQARLRAIAPNGQVTRATALRAVANNDGSEVQLIGQAQVVHEARGVQMPVRFESEFLHAFLEAERVISNRPVTITQGETVVHAERMEYNHADQLVRFSGRTRASFAPTATKRTP